MSRFFQTTRCTSGKGCQLSFYVILLVATLIRSEKCYGDYECEESTGGVCHSSFGVTPVQQLCAEKRNVPYVPGEEHCVCDSGQMMGKHDPTKPGESCKMCFCDKDSQRRGVDCSDHEANHHLALVLFLDLLQAVPLPFLWKEVATLYNSATAKMNIAVAVTLRFLLISYAILLVQKYLFFPYGILNYRVVVIPFWIFANGLHSICTLGYIYAFAEVVARGKKMRRGKKGDDNLAGFLSGKSENPCFKRTLIVMALSWVIVSIPYMGKFVVGGEARQMFYIPLATLQLSIQCFCLIRYQRITTGIVRNVKKTSSSAGRANDGILSLLQRTSRASTMLLLQILFSVIASFVQVALGEAAHNKPNLMIGGVFAILFSKYLNAHALCVALTVPQEDQVGKKNDREETEISSPSAALDLAASTAELEAHGDHVATTSDHSQ